MDNGNYFGNDAFMWIFALLILCGGGFGGGFFGGNNGVNTLNADMQRGFDNQNAMANQREILSAVNAGTAQTVATANQTFHDNLAAMQSLYNETARDIAALAVGQANLQASQQNCCCETKQLIMQNNYDAAMRDATTNANFTQQIQSVKDMIAQNKIEALQAQVSQLQLAQAMSGVMKFPSSWSYNAGTFPPVLA